MLFVVNRKAALFSKNRPAAGLQTDNCQKS